MTDDLVASSDEPVQVLFIVSYMERGSQTEGAAGGYESDSVVGDIDEKYYFTKTRGNGKKQGPEFWPGP